MNVLNRFQPLIIICCALLGLALGGTAPRGTFSIVLVEIFLMFLLFIIFLSVDMQQVKKALLHVKYTATSLAINFIITPFLAYGLGGLFFENAIAIRMGLLMLLVTPCTDWYLVFTKLSRGNVEINMAILPLNLVLQVALLPVYLFLFFGNAVSVPLPTVLYSIALVLVIPFFCAMLMRKILVHYTKIQTFLAEQGDNAQLVFLCLAVLVMFASEGQSLVENYALLLKLFVPLLCFFVAIFFVANVAAKWLKFSTEERIALHFTTMARNSPLALAIAISAFPTEPLISLALVIGPLLELPVLSLVSGILKKSPR